MDQDYHQTTDHSEIMEWAKERGGVPAVHMADEGLVEPRLKINFAADDMDDNVQEMTWDQFFEELDSQQLALRYKEINHDGRSSFYCQFVSRDLENAR